MEGTQSTPNPDSSFEMVLLEESEILDRTRQAMARGEVLQGRRYAPLPDDRADAFAEVMEREADAINKAISKLGERRSI